MRSTIIVSFLLVLLSIAIVGGVVIYSPDSHDPNTIVINIDEIDDLSEIPPEFFTVVSKPTPLSNSQNVSEATEEAFDPITSANEDVNMQIPIPASAITDATQRTWAGYVFNAVDQKPVTDVSVNLNGQVTVGTRDVDGLFTSEFPIHITSVSATLSYPGYHSIEVSLKRDHNQNIFFLIPEGGLFIEVIDNASRPVLYAQIELKSNSGFWSKSVTADIRGRYFEPNPPDASLTISASYQGYTNEGQARKIVEPPFSDKVTLQAASLPATRKKALRWSD